MSSNRALSLYCVCLRRSVTLHRTLQLTKSSMTDIAKAKHNNSTSMVLTTMRHRFRDSRNQPHRTLKKRCNQFVRRILASDPHFRLEKKRQPSNTCRRTIESDLMHRCGSCLRAHQSCYKRYKVESYQLIGT